MSANHISNDSMIDALYGLSDAGVEEHVVGCSACRARWNELQERRGAIVTPVHAPAARMAEQRQEIFRRIEHPTMAERAWGNGGSRWAAPALAGVAACVLAIGVLVHSPAPPTGSARPVAEAPAANPAAGDTQVFSDVYAMEQSFEPSASASLGVLFERPEGTASSESVVTQ